MAVEFLNSKKYHKKGIFPFHFLKVPPSKPLLTIKKTTPLNLFQRKISGIIRSCNSFSRIEGSRPDSKGLTEEDTQHPSTAKQNVGWRQLSVSCGTLKEENPQAYLEDKNEQGLKSETTSHVFIPIRADILEIQGQSKQAAATNMQIKPYTYCGLAGRLDIHTVTV